MKDPSERKDNILVDICLSGDRSRTARALPGPPLCLAGVGYDKYDMSIYKFMPKIEYNALLNEKKKMMNSNNGTVTSVVASFTADTTTTTTSSSNVTSTTITTTPTANTIV